jgi:hypothetical protein
MAPWLPAWPDQNCRGRRRGSFLCAYLEAADPVDANRRFAASTRPYDVWFKDQLKDVFPPQIDFNQPLPPVESLFDFVA